MTGEELARLTQLLERVLELPAAERGALVAQLGAENVENSQLLRRSLAGPSSNFMDPVSDTQRVDAARSKLLAQPTIEQPGERVGPYVLGALLGSGGMGRVWLAERVDGELQRQVALKLSTRWLVSGEQLRRERDILAALEHPNIARLYDAGVTTEGRPYLALERVDGEPIDAYCRRREASVEHTLALFLEVARAVSYAHARFVVHRDLKPANIFVSNDGHVRLLDFGIARFLDHSGDGTTLLDARALTPSFASPEQIAGERVTVASDVYSLGVVLYLLLTGERPYELASDLNLAAVARAVRSAPIVVPSRRVKPRALAKRLRGDLDAIVLKALARELVDRYPNVEAFSADIERHLASEPVHARSISGLYLLERFVKRHRLAVSAAGLVLLATLGGATVALREASVARAQARRAERVKDFIAKIFTEATPRTGVGGEVTAVDLLTAAANRLETTLEQEPRVAAELGVLLGDSFEAMDARARALSIAKRTVQRSERELGPRHPLTLHARLLLVGCDVDLNDWGQVAALLGPLIADARSQMPSAARTLASALIIRARESAQRGRREDAITAGKEMIEIAERYIGVDDDKTIGLMGRLSGVYGFDLRLPKQQLALVTDAYRRAKAKYDARRPALALAKAESDYASALLSNDRPAEAATLLERVVADIKRLDTVETLRMWSAMQRLAEAYQTLGRVDQAVPLARHLIDLEARLDAVDSEHRAVTLSSAARTLTMAGLLDEALTVHARLRDMIARNPSMQRTSYDLSRAHTLVLLGREEGDRIAAELASGPNISEMFAVPALTLRAEYARLQCQPARAATFARDAVERAAPEHVMPYTRARAHCELGLDLLETGQQPEAAPEIQRGLEMYRQLGVPVSLRTVSCAIGAARLALAGNRAPEAIELLSVLDHGYSAAHPSSPFRGEVLLYLAQAQRSHGEAAVAAQTAASARTLLAKAELPALRALLKE